MNSAILYVVLALVVGVLAGAFFAGCKAGQSDATIRLAQATDSLDGAVKLITPQASRFSDQQKADIFAAEHSARAALEAAQSALVNKDLAGFDAALSDALAAINRLRVSPATQPAR